jgi:hypothetical protein
MRTYRIGLGLAAVALCAAACGGGSQAAPSGGAGGTGGGPEIQLGTQFTMAPGAEASISGSSVHVRFDSVSDDSRCKPGQTCIWEGDATVHLTVGGSPVALHTSKRVKPQDATLQGYRVQLMALTADAEDATILVSKA